MYYSNRLVVDDIRVVLKMHYDAVKIIPMIEQEIEILKPKSVLATILSNEEITFDQEIETGKMRGLETLLKEKKRLATLHTHIPLSFIREVAKDKINYPVINKVIFATYLSIKNGMSLEESRVLFKGTIASLLLSIVKDCSKRKAEKEAQRLSLHHFGDERAVNTRKKGDSKTIATDFSFMIKLP